MPREDRRTFSLGHGLMGVAFVAALGAIAFSYVQRRSGMQDVTAPQPVPLGSGVVDAKAFKCDGRRRCAQMNSCEEAKQFIRNCPGMEMDGDRDGIPCEQSLCD